MPSVTSTLNGLQSTVHKQVLTALGLKRSQSKQLKEAIRAAFDSSDLSTLVLAKKPKKEGAKRPQNCYMLYCNEVRPKFKQENPSLSVGAIAKLIGASWKTLSVDDKSKYVEAEKVLKAVVPAVEAPAPAPVAEVAPVVETKAKKSKKVVAEVAPVPEVPVVVAVAAPVVPEPKKAKVSKAKKTDA